MSDLGARHAPRITPLYPVASIWWGFAMTKWPTAHLAVAGLLLSAISCPAVAQPGVEQRLIDALTAALGTISTNAAPTYTGGQLDGCGIEFSVLARDWIYKQGGFIRVGGQVGLLQTKKGPVGIMKIVFHDVDPKTMVFSPAPPGSAHLIARDFSTNSSSLIDRTPSDTPGAIFLIFKPFPTLDIIAQGLANNRITMGVSRKSGAGSIQVVIDTSVEDAQQNLRSQRTQTDFGNCLKQLIK